MGGGGGAEESQRFTGQSTSGAGSVYFVFPAATTKDARLIFAQRDVPPGEGRGQVCSPPLEVSACRHSNGPQSSHSTWEGDRPTGPTQWIELFPDNRQPSASHGALVPPADTLGYFWHDWLQKLRVKMRNQDDFLEVHVSLVWV